MTRTHIHTIHAHTCAHRSSHTHMHRHKHKHRFVNTSTQLAVSGPIVKAQLGPWGLHLVTTKKTAYFTGSCSWNSVLLVLGMLFSLKGKTELSQHLKTDNQPFLLPFLYPPTPISHQVLLSLHPKPDYFLIPSCPSVAQIHPYSLPWLKQSTNWSSELKTVSIPIPSPPEE